METKPNSKWMTHLCISASNGPMTRTLLIIIIIYIYIYKREERVEESGTNSTVTTNLIVTTNICD